MQWWIVTDTKWHSHAQWKFCIIYEKKISVNWNWRYNHKLLLLQKLPFIVYLLFERYVWTKNSNIRTPLGLWPGRWKPGPPPGLNEKKNQPDSTHRGNFFNGAGDGLNPRVRGPTRAVAPSSSHIEKLVILYACGLKKDRERPKNTAAKCSTWIS